MIPSVGLFYSVRHIIEYGGSWDFIDTVFVVWFLVGILFILNQRVHVFNKQNQTVTTYWAIGLPFSKWYLMLPWVWRDYSGEKISKLKVHRTSKRDPEDRSGRTRFYTYHVEAMISRKYEKIADYNKPQLAVNIAMDIGEFLGVPVVDKLSELI